MPKFSGMIEICAIASGSNGNCYYVGNQQDAILVDVGIFRKQVLLRMDEVGLDIHKVRAIFISHEHSDHMRGVRVLSKQFNIPVYMTSTTFNSTWKTNRPGNYRLFEPNTPVQVNSITVHPFLKKHDAVDPCSFRVEADGKHIGVMTDIGTVCENVATHFNLCDAAFLESNYDEEMLKNGTYPWVLKNRVASDIGHLSNLQSVELVTQHMKDDLELLILSHLSGENNTPDKAMEEFNGLSKKTDIQLSERHAATQVFTL